MEGGQCVATYWYILRTIGTCQKLLHKEHYLIRNQSTKPLCLNFSLFRNLIIRAVKTKARLLLNCQIIPWLWLDTTLKACLQPICINWTNQFLFGNVSPNDTIKIFINVLVHRPIDNMQRASMNIKRSKDFEVFLRLSENALIFKSFVSSDPRIKFWSYLAGIKFYVRVANSWNVCVIVWLRI